MSIIVGAHTAFDVHVPVVVIGAGACGLCAALAARDAGVNVLVLERDARAAGSTALSSGFIPASFTRFQREAGITDSAEQFAADIQRKNHGETDAAYALHVARESGPTIDWLADRHGIEFIVLDGFLYPGHSARRMHAVPEQTGAALMTRLETAAHAAGVDFLMQAQVTALIVDESRPDHPARVRGVRYVRPDGVTESVGCDALVLACSGFGGNAALVREHLPEIACARYFGHVGNQGDAISWGRALGAAIHHLGAYQGHGSVAAPHGILITWALMAEGGIQLNRRGERFANEQQGYSEAAMSVLAQPEGIAWDVYDERLHRLGLGFEDYRQAEAAGAVRRADSAAALAQLIGAPVDTVARTLGEAAALTQAGQRDRFGRDFSVKPALIPPYYAIRVTGALFHTQGGLMIDHDARVLRDDGSMMPNLFAGGGAACGVSGAGVSGYLSGNGLLAAVTLGRLAGASAARRAT